MSALPDSDRIVYALWRSGEVRAARELASAAVQRSDARSSQLRVQIGCFDCGEPPVSAEPVELTFELVAALVDRNRYGEANALLGAIGTPADAKSQRLVACLQQVTAPLPSGVDPSYGAVLQLVRAGQAPSCLRALDEVIASSSAPPPWLTARQSVLADLVHGTWRSEEPAERMTRDTVLERVRNKDMQGALEAARAAGAKELSGILRRLMAATEEAVRVEGPDVASTAPMEGHSVCELHIRMGKLLKAENGYRHILAKRPRDEKARRMLLDVIALRALLGEEVEEFPSRAPSVAVLKKNSPRPRSFGGWESGSEVAKHRRFEETSIDESTAQLEPAQEAELLLKLGKAEHALDILRLLAVEHPQHDAFRRRIAEIEALIAQRVRPLAAEATERYDLSDLSAKAIPTHPRQRLADIEEEFPQLGAEGDDEGETLIDAIESSDE